MNQQELHVLLDNLYKKGYEDRQKERDYDPRGSIEWEICQEVMSAQLQGAGEAVPKFRHWSEALVDDLIVSGDVSDTTPTGIRQ